MDLARRSLLFGRAAALPPMRPPWSRQSSVQERCTGCGSCVDACPVDIVSLGAGRLAEIDLSQHECTFCHECARACPEGVFDTSLPAFEHVAHFGDSCLPHAGIECRACQDACPEAAIRFRPRLGLPALPELNETDCTGCGACLAPCPADAINLAPRAREVADA
jgi:ferredoxin-type protein NapF